jgi:hypothetical protein
MGAGFPVSVPSHTVTMACISANQAITSGEGVRRKGGEEGMGERKREVWKEMIGTKEGKREGKIWRGWRERGRKGKEGGSVKGNSTR